MVSLKAKPPRANARGHKTKKKIWT
jgi:hypothetical protein